MPNRLFHLNRYGTNLRREVTAGVVSFFTIAYIIIINSAILADAGMPFEGAVIATVMASFLGCFLMGIWANAPIVVVPGMGLNALFSYTLVQSLQFHWTEALLITTISGFLFCLVAFTPLAGCVQRSVPDSLKAAMSVGIGLFLTFIGLQQGGLVVPGNHTLIELGQLQSPEALVTVITMVVAVILFVKNIPGHFLITIVTGTGIATLFGIVEYKPTSLGVKAFAVYSDVFAHFNFDSWLTFSFWMAVCSLTIVLLFENVGLIHGHTEMFGRPAAFNRSLQANALSVLSCGFLGTSPTVSTVESASGIMAGGRTGITAITTGILFLFALLLIPFIQMIPGSAIAPVLIIVGLLMLQQIKHIEFHNLSEGFPAFLIIVMIPFTESIADGMAFGFIAYPILNLLLGTHYKNSATLYVIALLFLANFVFTH